MKVGCKFARGISPAPTDRILATGGRRANSPRDWQAISPRQSITQPTQLTHNQQHTQPMPVVLVPIHSLALWSLFHTNDSASVEFRVTSTFRGLPGITVGCQPGATQPLTS